MSQLFIDPVYDTSRRAFTYSHPEQERPSLIVPPSPIIR